MPLVSTLITFVLTSVPGVTYCSIYSLLISSYSTPFKLIAIYYSVIGVTFINFFFSSIYFITAATCLFYESASKASSERPALGKKILKDLSPFTFKWHPSSSLDFTYETKTCPTLRIFSFTSSTSEKEI